MHLDQPPFSLIWPFIGVHHPVPRHSFFGYYNLRSFRVHFASIYMAFDLNRSVLVMKNIPYMQVIIIWVIIYVHVVLGYLNVHVTLPNNDLLVALLHLL